MLQTDDTLMYYQQLYQRVITELKEDDSKSVSDVLTASELLESVNAEIIKRVVVKPVIVYLKPLQFGWTLAPVIIKIDKDLCDDTTKVIDDVRR